MTDPVAASPTSSNDNRSYHHSLLNVKAPPFCTDRPGLWFAQLETQFYLHAVTAERDKFSLAVAHIATHHAAEIEDIITSPPGETPYTIMKQTLVERFSKSKEAKLQQLLEGECIGDRSPSTFLRHLKSLVPSIDQDVLRAKWCSALPEQTRVLLTTQSGTSLEQQAALADKLHELNVNSAHSANINAITPNPTSALENRVDELATQLGALIKSMNAINGRDTRRSRSRSKSNSYSRRADSTRRPSFDSANICYYHYTFKDEARKCIPGCKFQGNKSENH